MRILALETANFDASVAAAEGPDVLAESAIPRSASVSRALAPTLQGVLQQVGWQPQDIQLVAVTRGPGSFTGLRAGVTTAKVLAYATQAAVLGLNTLEIIAGQADVDAAALWVIMDAQRQQLFAAQYATAPGQPPLEMRPTEILDNETWLAGLQRGAAVSGPGLARLADRVPVGVRVSAQPTWAPRAATVARLAWLKYEAGLRDDLWTLAPQYFRLSAAEEKLRERS